MEIIQTDAAPQAIGPYSQGMFMEGWFFSSGQIPLNPHGEKVEGDIEAQARQVFQNLKAVLAAADLTLGDVIKTTVFVSDLNDFARLNAIYEESFGDHKPARSTVQVARLPLDVDVEIEVVARRA